MPALRDIYANSTTSGFTSDFFSLCAVGAQEAFLACPFFSHYEPVKELTARGCRVKLLVRLCSITTPSALRQALDDEKVDVRYFSDQSFHAKFYIIDSKALVGSANLTSAGLSSNREVSIVLRRGRDAAFEELPGLFDLLWDYADVLDDSIWERYRQAFRSQQSTDSEDQFQGILNAVIPHCAPPTIRVHSDRVTRRRSFLQGFRRKYDGNLVPAFNEVRGVFASDGRRRPEFAAADLNIEVDRFLGWIGFNHISGATSTEQPLPHSTQREERIRHYLEKWHASDNIAKGDMHMLYLKDEAGGVERIVNNFASPDQIRTLTPDVIFDTLCGCHAFHDRLRYFSGGLKGLRRDFFEQNSVAEIQFTLIHLMHGSSDDLERAYDCIYDEQYRLGGFGEGCVMELLGWTSRTRPPINGRTVKALRFLGFDAKE